MNAPLSSKIDQFITERLQRGAYKSAVEVIEDALEALAEKENFQSIRSEVDHADEQLRQGEFTEYDETTIRDLVEGIKARGLARLAAEHKPGA